MRTLSKVEYTGIPIDMELFTKLREKWDEIKGSMIAELDKEYKVFEGLTFKGKKFEEYLFRQRIYTWPRLKSGSLDLTEETFKEMAKVYPQLGPLKQLRWSLSQI